MTYGPQPARGHHIYHDAQSELCFDACEEQPTPTHTELHRDEMKNFIHTLRQSLRLVSRQVPTLRPPEVSAYVSALEALDAQDKAKGNKPGDRSIGLYSRGYIADGTKSAEAPIVIDTIQR